MLKRIIIGVLSLGVIGAVTVAQPAAAASGSSGHRPVACLPQGATCTYSSDCCSGSCAGASPAVCQ